MADGLRLLAKKYIKECTDIIDSNDRSSAIELQTSLVATFEGYIMGFGKNLDYDYEGIAGDYINNIRILKCKLEAFLATGCLITTSIQKADAGGINITNNSHANNSNTNTLNNSLVLNIDILFDETRKMIENNESLSEKEIEEVLEKIKEIEDISKLEKSKNKKWFKLRPTMEWLGTKGVAVATAVLGLISAIIKV